MTEVKNAEEVISEAYRELAQYTAKTRSYVGMLDGLKTSYRRTLTQTEKYHSFTKSATLVGETMKTHVHGDASIYNVLIMMTCRYGRFPLFKGKGNFGGLSFEASSSRYTEAFLTETARAAYLDLYEFADYGEGEVGNTEVTYLPAYLPYCFLAGSYGMTVGLPTPNIPALSPVELIDFCVAKLNNQEPVYPHINEGRCICEVSKKDMDCILRAGTGRAWYRPLIQKETPTTVSICEATPGSSLDRAVNRMKKYIDEDTVMFVNETSEKGYRYVFTLCNPSKLSMDKMIAIIDQALRSSVTYKIIVEKDGIVHYSSLDNIVENMLAYLQKCAARKFEKLCSDYEKKVNIYKAIDKLRNSDILTKLHTMTLEDLRKAIGELGYSEDVSVEVSKKPISYLTKEHDSERMEAEGQLEVYKKYLGDPKIYLNEQYQKLKQLVMTEMKDYCTRTLSSDELSRYATRKVILDNNRLYARKRGGYQLGETGCVLLVTKDCQFCRYIVPSTEDTVFELPEGHDYVCVESDQGKYFAVLYHDKEGNTCISINESSNIHVGFDTYIRLREEGFYTPIACVCRSSETLTIRDGSSVELSITCTDYLANKRRRFPAPIARGLLNLKFC